MKTMQIANTELCVPRLALGCMRINSRGEDGARAYVETALELGLNFFDHADIYGGGECEAIFSRAIGMSPSVREKIILQSKCGIRCEPGKDTYYDFSKDYILRSVDGILKRLGTEYLDILLLHRPDALMEPEEVAEAFDALSRAGKVRYFGVSNQKPMQIALLQKYLGQKIVINQLQFSITNATMVSNGINVNMENEAAVDRDGSVLDYCRLHDITIQPWSPFQYGFFEGVFLGNPKFETLNQAISALAEKYGVADSAIAIAWILRHPANMQPVIGSTDPARVRAIAKALDITLTREEWYQIYCAAGNVLP